jgi:hypothetical protein
METAIPNRAWWSAILCALFAVVLSGVLSGVALADSPVTPTTSSPTTATKPHVTKSTTSGSSSSSASAAHKTSTAHKTPAAHKTTGKKSAHKSGQTTAASRGKKSSKNQRSSKKRGQQAIDHDRAQSIQQALIREHYLQGAPSGTWDSTTQAAMQRYQADQGWQSKTTPDSRALIKLGLGPSNDHLLNPESAMTSTPAAGDPKAGTKADPAHNSLPHQ